MISQDKSAVDVVVIGGGPSGATTATLLAKAGHSVRLFERDHFPRFHIGESLIPNTFEVFDRLNMVEKLRSSAFVKKHSVQFVTEEGKTSAPFYFRDHIPDDSAQTWQVLRSEFDQLMLDNAREHGVLVQEGVRVTNVEFEGSRAVGVQIDSGNGAEFVPAAVVVDAAGMSGLIIDRLKLRQWDAELKKAAIWTYWRGAERDDGLDEGATLVMQTEGKNGWFWYIPLHDDIVSVGVVADSQYLFGKRASQGIESIYFEEVERCPGVQPRIAHATRADIFRAQKEFSYSSRQVAGDGWVLVGDALGFLDPLYSSGVLLALVSGAMAADAISEGLSAGDTSEARLRSWEAKYRQGMDRMRRLVREFYSGFSFGQFVRRHPDRKDLITDILVGNLFHDRIDELWPLMDAMRAENQAAGENVSS